MNKTIGQIAREIISANMSKSNAELLELVKEVLKDSHPNAQTGVNSIAWYKSQIVTQKVKSTQATERTIELVQAELEEAQKKIETLKEELETMKKKELEVKRAQYEELKKMFAEQE